MSCTEKAIGSNVGGTRLQYPEYKDFEAFSPDGPLVHDRPHKISIGAIYRVMARKRHHLSLGLGYFFISGDRLSAIGSVDPRPYVDDSELGYLTPPGLVDYYFSGRGAFPNDDSSQLNLTANYSVFLNNRGKRIELFVRPEVMNVFDEDAVTWRRRFISDATTDVRFQPFNPFTETPVQGVHWDVQENWGEAGVYQTPRTFRFSMGVRF